MENISTYFFNTHTHAHAYSHISLNIHGEHPRLQWVTPGYASFPISPLTLLPGSHTGGIWNLLAAESHRAIKPSKAHKRTRGRTSNNVGPTSCQQTQCILNLNKPHCSFFILSVSLYVSLNYCSPSQTPPGNESRKNFTFLPLNGIGTDTKRAKSSSGDWDRGETDTHEARI